MGFNYNWYKAGATTLPNKRVFNRYFKFGEVSQDDDSFLGLELTKKLADYVRVNLTAYKFLQQGERYFTVDSITGNILAFFALFGPIILGGVGSLACAFFFITSIIFGDDELPWLLLYVVLAWNIFWLNSRFLLNFIFRRFKGAYIDRKHQTISFTWRVKGNPAKNEFGHATFPLADIEAFYSKQVQNQQGRSVYVLCLAHKDHHIYDGAFLQTSVRDNPHNPNQCQLKWELIQRFADNSLPLPDMPDLEKFRHLDPVTAAYDKKHNRPEFHWRHMHIDQKIAIEDEVEQQAHNFCFNRAFDNPKRYGQQELEKPWLTWPIEQQYFADELAVPLWRRRAVTVLKQLTLSL